MHNNPLVYSAMDVSADLMELTRCPVGLVSAGVKSILDIGRYVTHTYRLDGRPLISIRTLEYLVRLFQSRAVVSYAA